MYIEFLIIINGKIKAKERPRISKWGVYTPKDTIDSENAIAWEWRNKYKSLFFDKKTALGIDITYFHKKSKNNKDEHNIIRPDLDNIVKTILDGLNKVAYADDSQIIQINARKKLSDDFNTIIKLEKI